MWFDISRRGMATAVLALIGSLAVAGCGSSSNKSSSAGPTVSVPTNSTIAGEVPARIKAKGKLTVAADATYAPNEFIAPDGKSVIGMDRDLVDALTDVMGLKAKVVNATFATIIPGMLAGRFDMGASSFTDTKERQKQVDFVTYLSVGEAFLTKVNGGPRINSLTDLCGRTVSVEAGTTEKDDATAQDAKCKAAGKPPIKLLVFPDQNGANLALSSGRAQVDFADSPIIAYQVRKLGVNVRESRTFKAAPYGIALPKGNGMAKPVLDALKELMANGTYAAILKKWQLQAAAITNPVINGATS
jgi:polar amino acid transport system substrate-binding protein